MELDDGTTVPITRNPGGRIRNAVPLLDAKRFPKGRNIALTKIRVSQAVTLQPEIETFVTVNNDQAGLIAVELRKKIFDSSMCLLGTGIEHVTLNTDLRILVANCLKDPKTITVGQTVAVAAEHPTSIMQTTITHVKHSELPPRNCVANYLMMLKLRTSSTEP